MKKFNIKVLVLSVVLGSMAVSCQKDYSLENNEICQKNLANVNLRLHYSIDGQVYQQTFDSKEDRENFISYLIGLTCEGRIIVIGGNSNPNYAPENKDTKTFTTSSKEEMDAWVNEMVEELYEVTVTFDKKTGLYTGTATPPGGGSRTTMAANLSQERE